MRFSFRTGLLWAGLLAPTLFATLFIANIGGWRARIISRLTRVDNYPVVVPAPPAYKPRVPQGFDVSVFARGFQSPRWLAVAPNGDVFVADSGAGQIIVLRPTSGRVVFADGLTLPFGIVFRRQYVYVADTNEVIRFAFDPRTSNRLGEREHVIDLPGLGYNQHWTRSLALSADESRLFVSVGSQTNESIESDERRAAIITVDLDSKKSRLYASGLRNAVGLATNPSTGELWAAVNERDDMGDDRPSDYFTHVVDGGFYGWPYSYLGANVDNRVSPRPDLVAKAIVPDVLLGAHVAPLQFAFYEGTQFPAEYQHAAFIAEHGSWNRRVRSGCNVTVVPFRDGKPSGPPAPFMTGFYEDASSTEVYGRPVGVAVQQDGSLLVSDDGAKVIWRVSYSKPATPDGLTSKTDSPVREQ
jgi:glucose/arabinose dehydrogenase